MWEGLWASVSLCIWILWAPLPREVACENLCLLRASLHTQCRDHNNHCLLPLSIMTVLLVQYGLLECNHSTNLLQWRQKPSWQSPAVPSLTQLTRCCGWYDTYVSPKKQVAGQWHSPFRSLYNYRTLYDNSLGKKASHSLKQINSTVSQTDRNLCMNQWECFNAKIMAYTKVEFPCACLHLLCKQYWRLHPQGKLGTGCLTSECACREPFLYTTPRANIICASWANMIYFQENRTFASFAVQL